MNAYITIPAAATVLLVAVVLPALNAPKVVSKPPPPGYAAQEAAQEARTARALGALRSGDPSRQAEVRRAIAGLHPNDASRPAFAALLARRGEAQAAYEAMRTRARFGELSLPNDAEMALYAGLAERAGHPEEAAWARERTGEDGHFRVWERGAARMFPGSRAALSEVAGMYESEVNRTMDDGLRLHPAHRAEIEAMRRELLDGGSPRP